MHVKEKEIQLPTVAAFAWPALVNTARAWQIANIDLSAVKSSNAFSASSVLS